MKLSHLRYIIEVAKTESITRAAQNLYIGQPNLSKVIKDMEADLGFTVFTRSSKGVVPTQRGAELIRRATEILEKADSFKEDYFGKSRSERLSVAVCGAERCIYAVEGAAAGLNKSEGFKLECFRCEMERATELVKSGEVSFAAVRTCSPDNVFEARLSQIGLKGQKLCSGKRQILMSRANSAAQKEIIEEADLEGCVKVVIYGADGNSINVCKKIIAVSGFESACRVLAEVKGSFMAISQRDCRLVGGELCVKELAGGGMVTDWAVFKEGKRFSETESEVIGRIIETT